MTESVCVSGGVEWTPDEAVLLSIAVRAEFDFVEAAICSCLSAPARSPRDCREPDLRDLRPPPVRV